MTNCNTEAHTKALKRLFQIAILLACCITSHAQRIIGELETNTDQDMIMGPDTTSRDKNNKKVVPVDVKAWTIDKTTGTRTEVDVDTLHHLYQNNDLPEGFEGHYNTLGNLGSPRQNRIFFERNEGYDFIFLNTYDMFYNEPSSFHFLNTKSPITNVSYNWCGTRNTGDDHFKVLFSRNAGKLFNFGFLFDYLYGPSYYDNLSTAFMNGTIFSSYTGDRYNYHLIYRHNHMKQAESGGIYDDLYITNPEGISNNFNTGDIPTNLDQTWNRQEHDVAFFNHKYNIGFTREEGDSTNLHEVFVPVTSIFHTFKLTRFVRKYTSNIPNSTYYTNRYLETNDENIIKDRTTNLTMRNTVGISLCEGFNKYAAAGINAYVAFENRRYTLPDTLAEGTRYEQKYNENGVFVGGQLIRTQGHHIHYNATIEAGVAGDDAGDLNLNGHGELNFKLLKDTAQFAIDAFMTRNVPCFYYERFHNTHAWWDKKDQYDSELRTRIQGTVTLERTHTKLSVGVENISKYTYFQNYQTLISEETASSPAVYSYAVEPVQHSGNIQIISANLRQDFKAGPLHLDTDVTYQASSDKDVLPLPTVSLFANLYLKFKIAKVLDTEFGGWLNYFTSYYASDYAPAINQFANQDKTYRMKIGNYPILTAYVNFHLKRTRFYLMYYHANQSDGNYFWAPHYPIAPSHIKFGLSWNFYD